MQKEKLKTTKLFTGVVTEIENGVINVYSELEHIERQQFKWWSNVKEKMGLW